MGQSVLSYYAKPGAMTALGRTHAGLVKALPSDIRDLVRVVQGLAIHQFVAAPFYGVRISAGREEESHLRSARQLLDAILEMKPASLATAREPGGRLVGVCHHFSKLLVAFLRAKGIPARMRYGFGDYFNPGFYEDHSVCEYWNADDRRWILVDPQFDGVWRKNLHITHDVLDVPRDRYLVAGEAWAKCRNGAADPARFGIFQGDLRGLWFVAGNLVKDAAALNKMEMLQWDAWPAMPRSDDALRDRRRLRFFDQLAAFTREPDASFMDLRRLYGSKRDRLHVPARVFNAVRGRLEKV